MLWLGRVRFCVVVMEGEVSSVVSEVRFSVVVREGEV